MITFCIQSAYRRVNYQPIRYLLNGITLEMNLLIFKVSNGAKIRNRYNQVPHLTQDTKALIRVHLMSWFMTAETKSLNKINRGRRFDSRLLHKTTFGWTFGISRHKINTKIINPPSPVLVTTDGKATNSFFLEVIKAIGQLEDIIYW